MCDQEDNHNTRSKSQKKSPALEANRDESAAASLEERPSAPDISLALILQQMMEQRTLDEEKHKSEKQLHQQQLTLLQKQIEKLSDARAIFRNLSQGC